MEKHWFIIVLICLPLFNLSAQKHYDLAITFNDQSDNNDILTLPDENFLLILNHTRKDTSETELLKLSDEGDTLAHRFLRLEGYTISSSGVRSANGCVLGIALKEGCIREPASKLGFAFIELDSDLNELRREVFIDPQLTNFPAGELKYSGDKFYLFHWNGVHVFDEDFGYLSYHKGFYYGSCRGFDVLHEKIVCTRYDSSGVFYKELDGADIRYLPRIGVNGVVADENFAYITHIYAVLKLDSSLTVVDSTHTDNFLGSFTRFDELILHKDELIGFDMKRFGRFKLPEMDIVPYSHGKFDDWGAAPVFLEQKYMANERSVGAFGLDHVFCGFPDNYLGMIGYFECSNANYVSPDPVLKIVAVDSLWMDSITRFPDYEPYEFNVDVGIQFINKGETTITEWELLIDHSLDSGCYENPAYFYKGVKGLKLEPGQDTMVFFKNLKLSATQDFDSLFLAVSAQATTQNKRGIYFNAECRGDYRYIESSEITERIRPKAHQPPATFSIYPNPTVDELKFDGLLNAGAELRIFNMAGQPVFHKKMEQPESDFVLDVSYLPDAVYFLQIRNSGFKEVTRFVKM